MNTERWIAKKIVFIFNPLFTSVYAFIYYLLLMVLFSNGYRDALSIVLKSITLYTLVSPLQMTAYFTSNKAHIHTSWLSCIILLFIA